SADRNPYCGEQRKIRRYRRARCSLCSAGDRKCRVRCNWKADPPTANSSDGGGMMRSHKLVRMALLIGFLAGTLGLSRSMAAPEQPAAPAPKSAAAAAASDQGALFT